MDQKSSNSSNVKSCFGGFKRKIIDYEITNKRICIEKVYEETVLNEKEKVTHVKSSEIVKESLQNTETKSYKEPKESSVIKYQNDKNVKMIEYKITNKKFYKILYEKFGNNVPKNLEFMKQEFLNFFQIDCELQSKDRIQLNTKIRSFKEDILPSFQFLARDGNLDLCQGEIIFTMIDPEESRNNNDVTNYRFTYRDLLMRFQKDNKGYDLKKATLKEFAHKLRMAVFALNDVNSCSESESQKLDKVTSEFSKFVKDAMKRYIYQLSNVYLYCYTKLARPLEVTLTSQVKSMTHESSIENFEFVDVKPKIKDEPVIKEEPIEVKKEPELIEDSVEAIRDSIEFEDVKPNIKLELNNVKDENVLKLSEPSTSKLDLTFCGDLTEEDFEDVSIVESSQSSNESSEMELDVNLNDSFESNHSQELLKAVTKHENEECQTEDSCEDDFHIFSEAIDIEETKPELTDSGLVTKVNLEIIKIEPNNDPHERVIGWMPRSDIPLMKKAVVSLPKLSDKTIKKYTKDSEKENWWKYT